MRMIPIGIAVLGASLATNVQPGHAQYWQGKGTWCIQPAALGSSWDCSYYSLQQCQMSLSGSQGSCVRSPAAYWDLKRKNQSREQRW